MDWLHRTVTLSVLAFTLAVVPATGQGAGGPAIALSPEQMETFLLKANVTRLRNAGSGVTGSRKATLVDGTFSHDVHIQVVNEQRTTFEAGKKFELNFKDLARYNVTGYRLAKLLGMDNVPMSVERNFDGKLAAFTWWVDDVAMDEKVRLEQRTAGPDPGRTSMQVQMMRVFDALIHNTDRNQGNMLWTGDWKLWLIDHTRAFRLDTGLARPEQLPRSDRVLLERLRSLTREEVSAALGRAITEGELTALMSRRDAIVKHFDERIKTRGEAAVLFTLPR